MMSYDDSTYLVIEIMTYDVSIKMKAKMCESLKKIVHCQYKSMNYHRNWILTGEIIRPIQLLKTKFHVAFLRIYDVIRLHQVSGSSNYDDVMTKQVPGVSGANLVGETFSNCSATHKMWICLNLNRIFFLNFKILF